MPLRSCTISVTSPDGVRHSVTVEAETLFEAAVLGVQRLNENAWVEQTIAKATPLTIDVREPGSTHTVSLQQIERWLSGKTMNPAETIRKQKLRAMLGVRSLKP
jgi:hypothetical protein